MPPLIALEFLTRLRFRRVPLTDTKVVARTQAWFPAVGLVIGALLLAVDRLATRALPEASSSVLVVVALAAITGGLHLDGLADSADGLLGGRTPEQRLAIMRDVRTGSFGVVAVVCVLAMKWAGLAALPPGVRGEAIVLTPCLARLAMLVSIEGFPPARAQGLGATFHDAARPLSMLAGSATAAIAGFLLLGPGSLYCLAAAIAFALAFARYVTSLAGGTTGDTYGATVEISEAAIFLFVAALANRGWIEAWLFG